MERGKKLYRKTYVGIRKHKKKKKPQNLINILIENTAFVKYKHKRTIQRTKRTLRNMTV